MVKFGLMVNQGILLMDQYLRNDAWATTDPWKFYHRAAIIEIFISSGVFFPAHMFTVLHKLWLH